MVVGSVVVLLGELVGLKKRLPPLNYNNLYLFLPTQCALREQVIERAFSPVLTSFRLNHCTK